jgi:urease beta subunit
MSSASPGPGEILFGEGDILLNEDRETLSFEVTNTGDRAIQVGSHFHFFEVNRSLSFPRAKSFGMRLDIPSGTAVRFEAGQTHNVTLVPYGGDRRILGFNDLTQGETADRAIVRATAKGFDLGGQS